MADKNDAAKDSKAAPGTGEARPVTTSGRAPGAPPDEAKHTDQLVVAVPPPPAPPPPPPPAWRKWAIVVGIVVGVIGAGYFLVPWVITALNTVSTDDAYVNGHVTAIAPRVAGQVKKVRVDDNQRVKVGDILVELDKEPYQVQVNIKNAAVATAERDLTAARAQARGIVAQTRSNRFKLAHAIEDVKNQVATLRANVANLEGRKASLELARSNLKRGEELEPKGGISKEDLDQRRQTVKVDEAAVEQALQGVYAIRVSLGLPSRPKDGQTLGQVPDDLDQNFSTVREALASTQQSAAQLGYFPPSWNATPNQAVAEFYKQFGPDSGTLDEIYDRLVREAPSVKQAEAKLQQARDDLALAELNLRYTDVVSDIDGQVTRRNVNPGNYVQTGQTLMALRSLTEIWIDANFKETQLANLRIGQRVRCEVDMYGSRHEFEGRITGFTMGTGQTLSLLPPQNATGNYVKIVQRLPVRIELTDYNPAQNPLFIGLSVTPYVYYKEPATGPHAGEYLQPFLQLPQIPANPKR